MKNAISVFYRYRPIRKLSLSGFIGIGRYEKKLIGRTLPRRHEGTPQSLNVLRLKIITMEIFNSLALECQKGFSGKVGCVQDDQ